MHRQRVSVLVDPLRRLLRRGAKGHVTNMLSKLHAADVARLLVMLTDEESDRAFQLLVRDDSAKAAEVLSELEQRSNLIRCALDLRGPFGSMAA